MRLISVLCFLSVFEIEFKSNLQRFNESIIIENCDLMLSEKVWNEIFKIEDFKNLLTNSHGARKDIRKLNLFEALSNFNYDAKFINKTTNMLATDKKLDCREHFPAQAPFLVAIFETLSNITAQTCGGVLLTTHWVLTASTCVYVLPYIYRNG